MDKRKKSPTEKRTSARARTARKKVAVATKPRPRKVKSAARKRSSAGGKTAGLKKTPLTAKQLKEFRELLLEKRRTLLGDMTGMEQVTANRSASGNLSSMPTHMADVGSDNFEHEFTLGLLESEQGLLREIDRALQRIEDKTYGICLGTGKPIPLARLRARPWAQYTVEYARMLEKGLVRPAEEADEVEATNETADDQEASQQE